MGSYFMGIEASTQQVKSVIIDESLSVKYEAVVQFDTDLPEFGTTGGVHKSSDGLTITSPVLMWTKAFEVVLQKLKTQGADFSLIKAVSGNGQQHGSVYWKQGSEKMLQNMKPNESMYKQLRESFAINDCPIWMDSSTTAQCRQLESSLGGPLAVAKLTGSRAYERFTGNQIMKIHQEQADIYTNTERISLVSSFAASLMLGRFASIDVSDGSGMNLLDITSRQWSEDCLKLCGGPSLRDKLGEPVDSTTCLGNVSAYFVSSYGFSPECKVIAFTGDNPASLAGMMLYEGDIVISLGSSDTLFIWLSEPHPQIEGHIFVNPVDSHQYMALLCFKNGSLTRDRIRSDYANSSWAKFDELLNESPVGNNGNMGIYFDIMEITPHARGCYRWNADDVEVNDFTPSQNIRACIEGQILAKRIHAEAVGYKTNPNSKILATGGASANKLILQIISDVFNMPVYTSASSSNSACLGCAYRAIHGYELDKLAGVDVEKMSFADCMKSKLSGSSKEHFILTCKPIDHNVDVYSNMLGRYKKLELSIIS